MEFLGPRELGCYEHMRSFHTLAFFCDDDVVMSLLLVQFQVRICCWHGFSAAFLVLFLCAGQAELCSVTFLHVCFKMFAKEQLKLLYRHYSIRELLTAQKWTTGIGLRY